VVSHAGQADQRAALPRPRSEQADRSCHQGHACPQERRDFQYRLGLGKENPFALISFDATDHAAKTIQKRSQAPSAGLRKVTWNLLFELEEIPCDCRDVEASED